MSRILIKRSRLVGKKRTVESNKSLGLNLAFIAGAINAGGFIAVQQYTSHMTGVLSLAADSIVLKNWVSFFSMVLYIFCFILGAATTVIMVMSARKKHLNSQYAWPLIFEAILLIIFGIVSNLYKASSEVYIYYMVALLCYLMGLQNALITKISNTTIRTTHVTGMITDIGIELGKLLSSFSYNKEKIFLHSSVVLMFFIGGVLGAYGFKYIGFLSVFPLSGYLLFISYNPIKRDLILDKYLSYRLRRKQVKY